MFGIRVRFVHGVYEATSNDAPGEPEWPPHPARAFSALLAVADTDADRAALDWLESLTPPEIRASALFGTSRRGNYVITNDIAKGKSHMEFSGRVASGRRSWARVSPQLPLVDFIWSDDAGSHAAALTSMARRLPYLGRSTSPVIAEFFGTDLDDVGPMDSWQPDRQGSVDLTVPRRGYRSALADAFDHEVQPWTVARTWCRYRSPLDVPQPESTIEHSPYEELIVFGIEGRAKPPWNSVVRYTTALRGATLANLHRTGIGAGPVELHGHASDGHDLPRHRVMIVGLPFVGSDHADGHLLGFGVCVPTSMSSSDRAELYRGLLDVDELHGPGLPKVRLSRRAGGKLALDPSRWCSPSSTWVTAYPIVLDRHVKHDDQVEPLLRLACQHMDLPDPVRLDWSRTPLLSGTDRMRPNQLVRRRGERARPAVHASITFDRPVAGPIVLGNMRHLGLGLLLPTQGGHR